MAAQASSDFIRIREKDWKRLETLINRRRGRGTLSADEIRELGSLYRAVTSDLAQARRDYPGQRVTAFLNQLLTRTHSYIYQEDVSDLRPIMVFVIRTLPRTFRQTWVFTLTAFLIFMIPAVVGYRLTYANPDIATPLGLDSERQTLADHDTWTNIPVNARPYAASFIMSNNIRVAILAFGGGIVFGLFGVYLLASNGLSVGAVLGLAAHYQLGQALLGFMVGHGVIELSVIFISAGAGLQLGWALINPGPYSRGDALVLAAHRAVTLVIAAVPLLVIAGTIEGMFSPSTVYPFSLHVAVGLFTGIILYSYLLFAGHGPGQDKASLGTTLS
jgi:uncharacterized membrane protein SpoIIM required for sporulation